MDLLLTPSMRLYLILSITVLGITIVHIVDKIITYIYKNNTTDIGYVISQLCAYIPLLTLIYLSIMYILITPTDFLQKATLSDKQQGKVPTEQLAEWENNNIAEYINTKLPLYAINLSDAKITSISPTEMAAQVKIPSSGRDREHTFLINTTEITHKELVKYKSTSKIFYKVLPTTITPTYKKNKIIGLKLYIQTKQ